jgi:hypothetical protein
LCLERATIAEWQGASEDQKFVAKPTQLNMNLFLANGIKLCHHKMLLSQKDHVFAVPTKPFAEVFLGFLSVR